MDKINFTNNSAPYINAENLNQLQSNVEEAISKVSVKYNYITGLNLPADSTYKIDLPKNTLFIEPLVASAGNGEGGGMFVPCNDSFCYLVNNDLDTSPRGIWIKCDANGMVYISNYRHCGAAVTAFRIWYLGTE